MLGLKTALTSALLFTSMMVAQAAEPATEDKTAIVKSVSAMLKDPYSAKFKWSEIVLLPSGLPSMSKEHYMYCGSVNAKNSYGAYTGYARFLVMVDHQKNSAAVLYMDDETEQVCHKVGLLK